MHTIKQHREINSYQMKSKPGQSSQIVTCSICLQRNSNSALDNCSHLFCIRCIRKWSKKHNSCPLCREEYRTITYKNQTIPVEVPERAQRRPVVQRTLTPPQRRILFLPVHTLPSFPQVYPFTMFPAPHLQFFMMNSLLFPPLPTFYPQVPVTSLNLSLS